LLQLITAIILGQGIFKIRSIAKSEAEAVVFNVEQVIFHFGAFMIYAASILVIVIFYTIYLYEHTLANRYNYFVAVIVSNFLSMFSQICMLFILWGLASKKPDNQVDSEEDSQTLDDPVDTYATEVADEELEEATAIWNLMVRKQNLPGWMVSHTASRFLPPVASIQTDD
jgi:hypothetical protein